MPSSFKCPSCGSTDFYAFYLETSRQDVALYAGADGNPDPALTDYQGCLKTVGDGGEDDQYACEHCEWIYDVPDTSPPAPVWIVLRDLEGEIEVDVFTTEEAAREHAARISDSAIVREETVAVKAWASEAIKEDA